MICERCSSKSGSEHTSNSANLEAGANLRGQLALGATEHNVNELGRGRNRSDLLPCGLHVGVAAAAVFANGNTRRRKRNRSVCRRSQEF